MKYIQFYEHINNLICCCSLSQKQYFQVVFLTLETFFFNFWRKSVLLWGHWCSYFGLVVMFALGFKARVDFFAWMLHHQHTRHSDPSICEQTLVGLKTGIYHVFHYLTVWDQADSLPTELCTVPEWPCMKYGHYIWYLVIFRASLYTWALR